MYCYNSCLLQFNQFLWKQNHNGTQVIKGIKPQLEGLLTFNLEYGKIVLRFSQPEFKLILWYFNSAPRFIHLHLKFYAII